MPRKRFDEQHENHERWLISYADFITLLFAFFVVMYAISSVNEGKYRVFSESLGTAFGGPGSSQHTDNDSKSIVPPIMHQRAEAMKNEREKLTKLASDLKSTLAPLVKEGKVRVTQNSRGISVEINASVLFDPGEARLQPDSVTALRPLGVILKNDPHFIQVEGHTDADPISNTLFASNWELSAVRAAAVVRLFEGTGVPPQRLQVVGFGPNQPVAANDTAEGRARNRRVAVTILSALPDETTVIQAP